METNETESCCSLRERKRRRTRRALEDSATALVLDRGYQQVTIDDICAAADVSRRTFFNYFDSKDHVVFGAGLIQFTDEDVATFSNQEHERPIMALVQYLQGALERTLAADDDIPEPIERLRGLRARRIAIIEQEPEVAPLSHSLIRTSLTRIQQSLVLNLENFPATRSLPELSVEEEALLGARFVQTVVSFTLTHADNPFAEHALEHDARVYADLVARLGGSDE